MRRCHLSLTRRLIKPMKRHGSPTRPHSFRWVAVGGTVRWLRPRNRTGPRFHSGSYRGTLTAVGVAVTVGFAGAAGGGGSFSAREKT
jgi:hypothetical protein